ncbi:MAG: helix-turn-helix transcriptional regulator [Elusimicrobiaceae bacterium]|nr:helix-turn-helix transcriptional regulator [Elusimicrobiaceae bacterium]
MKRLKQLREAAHYTQEQLAQMLQVSQQTIARWENGKGEPNLTALRDLALIFCTSVDELLEYGKTGKKPSTAHYCLSSKELDGYWGDLGLKIGNEPSIWFPISEKTMSRIYNHLRQLDNENDWIAFASLNNKYVVFRPENMRRITLLDEACDGPQNDGELMEKMTPELYRAFNILNSIPDVNWNEIRKVLLKERETSVSDETNKKFWKKLVKKITPYFDGEASETFIKTVIECFLDYSFDDDEIFMQHMCETHVYYNDGQKERFCSNTDDIDEFFFTLDIDDDVKMLKFTSFAEADAFIPLSKISAVVMPYTDVLEAEKKSKEMFEEEMENESAE